MNYLLLISLIFFLNSFFLNAMEPMDSESSFDQATENLLQAIERDDPEEVRRLLAQPNANVNTAIDDYTPLTLAATRAKLGILSMILGHESLEINHTDHSELPGNPLLHQVIFSLDYKSAAQVVRMLLENGDLDINARNQWGWTPLMEASYAGGHTSNDVRMRDASTQSNTLVSMLLNRGANPFMKSTDSYDGIPAESTALKIAYLSDKREKELHIVQLLTQYQDLAETEDPDDRAFYNIPKYLFKLICQPGFMQFIKDRSEDLLSASTADDSFLKSFFDPLKKSQDELWRKNDTRFHRALRDMRGLRKNAVFSQKRKDKCRCARTKRNLLLERRRSESKNQS